MRVSLLALLGCAASVYGAFKTPAGSNDTTPMQVRLAYAGSTGMVVSWNTFAQVHNPTVYYGTDATNLTHNASSNVSVTYPTSTTFNNHVQINGLESDMLYYYQVGSKSGNVSTFKTSRLVGDSTPYTIAVVVDMGTMGSEGLTTHVGTGAANPLAPGENNTIQALTSSLSEFDFLWQPGDLAYADYWLKEEIQGFLPNTTLAGGAAVYESILNEFYDEVAPISSVKPFMVGPGNHEANCDNGGTTDHTKNISYTVDICMPGQTNFTGFINHFRMPSSSSGGTGNFWYSFNNGMVHYIQLDTETDLGHGFISPDEPGGSESEDSGPFNTTLNAQTTWLSADLAAVNRTATPWIIVAGHRPWYVNYQNKSSAICTECKDVFEPLFLDYGVDLVLSGHIHAYQRNQPMFDYKVDPNGLSNPKFPLYITNGAAGHYDGLDVLQRPFTNYTAFAQDETYGWSRLTFHNCTHLTHEFVVSGNNSVLDTATLYKNRTCAAAPAAGGASSAASRSSSATSRTSTTSTFGAGSASHPFTASTLATSSVDTAAPWWSHRPTGTGAPWPTQWQPQPPGPPHGWGPPPLPSPPSQQGPGPVGHPHGPPGPHF